MNKTISILPILLACDATTNLSRYDDGCERYMDRIGEVCGRDEGECKAGILDCLGGRLFCRGEIKPELETCNGKDDDCNRVVDDVALVEFCYDGPVNTAFVGECRPGYRACVQGRWMCIQQTLPMPEDCGGRTDRDCNGWVDDVGSSTTTPRPIDVVLLIDRSCSMKRPLVTIKPALNRFESRVANDLRYEVWMTDIPGAVTPVMGRNEVCHPNPVTWPLKPCERSRLRPAIDLLDHSFGGVEPTYDALVRLAEGGFPIAWRPDSLRYAVMFADEPAESITGLTQIDVLDSLKDAGITFYGFTKSEFSDGYQLIANETSGGIFNLDGDVSGTLDLAFIAGECSN